MATYSSSTSTANRSSKRRLSLSDNEESGALEGSPYSATKVNSSPPKKRSRWSRSADNRAACLVDLPTAITANLTNEQLEVYAMHFRIREIGKKLEINESLPATTYRSASPPPEYNEQGRRINTREQRYRKSLQEEQHELVRKIASVDRGYRAPNNYRKPTSHQEKVYVPVKDFPEINFIGQLIGPRGETLKEMQAKTGAKILLRGKGSVKEGRGSSNHSPLQSAEDDLHCLIIAKAEGQLLMAKSLVNEIIENAASSPEILNELKQKQLRHVAEVNGTLRDDESQTCQNCGQVGHRNYNCTKRSRFSTALLCSRCDTAGHLERDCRSARHDDRQRSDSHDEQYRSLMQELTNNGISGVTAAPGVQHSVIGACPPMRSLPPWRQAGSSHPERSGSFLVMTSTPPWRR